MLILRLYLLLLSPPTIWCRRFIKCFRCVPFSLFLSIFDSKSRPTSPGLSSVSFDLPANALRSVHHSCGCVWSLFLGCRSYLCVVSFSSSRVFLSLPLLASLPALSRHSSLVLLPTPLDDCAFCFVCVPLFQSLSALPLSVFPSFFFSLCLSLLFFSPCVCVPVSTDPRYGDVVRYTFVSAHSVEAFPAHTPPLVSATKRTRKWRRADSFSSLRYHF